MKNISKSIVVTVSLLSITLIGVIAVTYSPFVYAFTVPISLPSGAVEIISELNESLASNNIDKANEILALAKKEFSDPQGIKYDYDAFKALEGKTDPTTLYNDVNEVLTSVSSALENDSPDKALEIIDYKMKQFLELSKAISKAILSPSIPKDDEGDTLPNDTLVD